MSDFSLSFDGKNGGTIRVDADISMVSPEQCTFKVSEPLYPEHSAHFSGKEQSQGSPLVDKLFDLGNIPVHVQDGLKGNPGSVENGSRQHHNRQGRKAQPRQTDFDLFRLLAVRGGDRKAVSFS